MITSFLSKAFWLAFVLLLLSGIGNIISQLTLRPLQLKGDRVRWTLGSPGLGFNARVISQNEKQAPDTTIYFSYKDKSGRQAGNGTISLTEGHEFQNRFINLDSIIKDKKSNGEEIKVDTQITFIGEIEQNNFDYTFGSRSVDSIQPNIFIHVNVYGRDTSARHL